VHFYSLEDVLMEESRLYLIFEFLSMDLKKFLDSLGPNKVMDGELIRSYLYQVNLNILVQLQTNYTLQDLRLSQR
jgi:cyclin-dependent kinase 1